MPKAKYDQIYRDLKSKIETGEYEFQELLPSENQLVLSYECSRNTVRRAISALIIDGYVQSMQGKGVRIIYQNTIQTAFTLGTIETFKESALRNHQKARTKVIFFSELTVDEIVEARKVIGDSVLKQITNRGLVFNPVRINNFNKGI